jgi:hypothetical protein
VGRGSLLMYYEGFDMIFRNSCEKIVLVKDSGRK